MAALAWNLKSWYGLPVPNRERGLELVKAEFRGPQRDFDDPRPDHPALRQWIDGTLRRRAHGF